MRSGGMLISVVGVCAGATVALGAPELVYGQRPVEKNSGRGWHRGDTGAMADDFTLAADTQVLSASFWGFLDPNSGTGWPDVYTLAFWADVGGLPDDSSGSPLFEQTFNDSELTKTAAFDDVFRLTADFATPVQLSGATKYWFSIGFPQGDGAFIWMFQGLAGPDPLGTAPIALDNFTDNFGWKIFEADAGDGFAFSLNGEPEMSVIPLPSASALAGLGLAGLAARRRRVRC